MKPDTSLPDNNRQALRQVARACRKASLSTLMDGAPYVSLVTIAFAQDLSPILLLSGLAEHTRHLQHENRVALLLDGTDGHPNPQTGPRVTLTGRAEKTADPRCRARFLARHPGAAMYADFGDFAFWRILLDRAHFVGGFGRAVWFDAPFGLSPQCCDAIEEGEELLVAEMNTTHAQKLDRCAGADGVGWRVVGADCDGLDMAREDLVIRRNFPISAESFEDVRRCAAVLMEESGA